VKSLFQNVFRCPVCSGADWIDEPEMRCRRCGYFAKIDGRFISLLPEHLSENNQRESRHNDREDPSEAAAIANYHLEKPWNYSPIIKERYLRAAGQIASVAHELQPDARILFVFAGGGMESHVSGLLGENVVLADIADHLLHMADARFRHYGAPQPAAYVQCDAEHLPFQENSFDFVVGFEGVHHCLVPQAAMHEIWRVTRRRALIVDNYECLLTKTLYRLGASSQVEDTGVRPSRFSSVEIETMLYNANIKHFALKPCAALPYGFADRVGRWLGKPIEWAMNKIWQPNMFMLTTYHD
jgi:hypothetical protein